MRHHRHSENVYVDFLPDSLNRNFVKNTDIGDAHIVDQNGDVEARERMSDTLKELGAIGIDKVSDNALCFDGWVCIRRYSFESLLHFKLVASNQGDIEAEGGEFFAEGQADAIAPASYYCPRGEAVPLSEILGREDCLEERPEYLGDPENKDYCADDCEEIDEIEGRLLHKIIQSLTAWEQTLQIGDYDIVFHIPLFIKSTLEKAGRSYQLFVMEQKNISRYDQQSAANRTLTNQSEQGQRPLILSRIPSLLGEAESSSSDSPEKPAGQLQHALRIALSENQILRMRVVQLESKLAKCLDESRQSSKAWEEKLSQMKSRVWKEAKKFKKSNSI